MFKVPAMPAGIDVYAQKYLRSLSSSAAEQIGIDSSKEIWRLDEEFWKDN